MGGVFLRKGTTVLVSPFAVHRDSRFWASPPEFRPERFAQGGEAEGVPRHAYLPFGAGPRRCLAENLAQVEMMLAVSRILQRFELELPSQPLPRLAAGFALVLRMGSLCASSAALEPDRVGAVASERGAVANRQRTGFNLHIKRGPNTGLTQR